MKDSLCAIAFIQLMVMLTVLAKLNVIKIGREITSFIGDLSRISGSTDKTLRVEVKSQDQGQKY